MIKPSIVCVDDEKIVLDSLKAQLKKLFKSQCIIELAESGEEALEIIEDMEKEYGEPPSVVISDQVMPVMKGDELLTKIEKKYPETKKILLTGLADKYDIVNAINNANLYRYIEKPWEYNDLSLTVKEAVTSFVRDREISLKSQELSYLNEELRMFIYRASHDFRGPLATLLGLGSLGERSVYDKMTKDLFKKVSNTSLGMENMLRKFLMMHKINEYNLEFTDVPLNIILLDLIEDMKPLLDHRNIDCQLFLESPLTIFSNKDLLRIILSNVIENSIYFYNEKRKQRPYIHIYGNKEGEGLNITIKDNGIGMDKREKNRAFEMFYRGSNASEGNGLGLYVTKKAVEALQGSIKLTGSPQKGLDVNIVIPKGQISKRKSYLKNPKINNIEKRE